MSLSENCTHRNTQTWAKEKKKNYGNFPTLYILPSTSCLLFKTWWTCMCYCPGHSRVTQTPGRWLFVMEGKELLLSDLEDKFRTTTFQNYVLPPVGKQLEGRQKRKYTWIANVVSEVYSKGNVTQGSCYLLEFPEHNKLSWNGHLQGVILGTVKAIVGSVIWR